MKRLTLLRHGHAIAETPAGAGDAERVLSAAGLAEARDAGRRFAARFGSCDLMLVSAAARTRQTADAAMTGGLQAKVTCTDRRLYLATPAELLEVVREQADGCEHVLLVGHNPGLSELAARLARDPGFPGLGTAEWRSFELDAIP